MPVAAEGAAVGSEALTGVEAYEVGGVARLLLVGVALLLAACARLAAREPAFDVVCGHRRRLAEREAGIGEGRGAPGAPPLCPLVPLEPLLRGAGGNRSHLAGAVA